MRRCLKPDLKADALKREVISVKFTKWEGGKPVGEFFHRYIPKLTLLGMPERYQFSLGISVPVMMSTLNTQYDFEMFSGKKE